jgi:hypothetical protein
MATTLVTYADVIEEVLSFGLNDGPQVNKARIERWINEGMFQIVRQVEATEFQKTDTITLVQGQYKYALPTDFYRAQDVYYPEMFMRLRPVDLQQFDTTAPKVVEGPPAIYAMYAGEVWFFPTPYNSTDTLELRYIKEPKTLVAPTDVPELSANYLFLLVEYALMKAFAGEDDPESSAMHQKEFKAGVAAFATDQQNQQADRPKVLDGTWSGGGYGGRII